MVNVKMNVKMNANVNAKVNAKVNARKMNVITKVFFTILLMAFTIVSILPFVWMISSSLKYEADIFVFPIEWIPKRFNAIENYTEVLTGKYNFSLYYLNTIKITVLSTFFQVTFSAMAGYAFAKINFKYKNILFTVFLSVMMIPEQVTLVPRFMLSRYLGLYNTHAIIIILLSFSAYGTFLMRQYMVTIPQSLSESAKIDGANHVTIFTRIVLPMSKPIIATLTIIKFVWTWNDYQTSLVFLQTRDLYTIQLGIQQFSSESGAYYSLQMAAAVLAIIPLFIIFLLGQKYIIEGITAGAIKG